MQSTAIQRVCQKVYRRFPELRGVHPQVRSAASGSAGTWLLTFQCQVTTQDQRQMTRRVQVTAHEDGRIVKMASSHG